MKHFYLLICLFAFQVCFAQQKDPRTDRYNYEPDEIIVKLKDNFSSEKSSTKSMEYNSTQVVGEILGIDHKVKKSRLLFEGKSVELSLQIKRTRVQKKALAGSKEKADEKEIASLKNIFLLKLQTDQDNPEKLIEELSKHPAVEYVEPNYRFSVNDFTINSEVLDKDDLRMIKATEKPAVFFAPNDPLYPQQTNMAAVNLDKLWETGFTGDGNQIIAILDTGIDYEHPDLKNNIWINQAELNGLAGFDDDGNGFIDDVQGWNFVNSNNAPLDDNLHGTHVAGIAGARGNNELGVAGAAWHTKLMPVKVFESNGMGNVTTIAKGLEYAVNNGATIINMSFGSTARSLTLEAALQTANESAVLVAAAGNDGRCIGPEKCPDKSPSSPSFPAAYEFVLGVQDNATYSNYDQDGPTFSGHPELFNYELKAPGTDILSTVPGGGYRSLTGTSMSAPLVAGGIAVYLHHNPGEKKGALYGNLINTSKTYVDFLAALNTEPTSRLKIISAMTKDTLIGQNGNGFLEPGEVVDIFPLVKNYWGFSNDVRVGIEFAAEADTAKADILKNTIAIGSISEYATLHDLKESLQVKIAENVPNNDIIRFKLNVWSANSPQAITSTDFKITVKNSVLLFGIISTDMTLTPDKEYLVSDNLIINKDATITILPGTTVKISNGKKISTMDNGRIIAVGNKNDRIIFINEDVSWLEINPNSTRISRFEFCRFSGFTNWFGSSSSKNFVIEHSEIINTRAWTILPYYPPSQNILLSSLNIHGNRVRGVGSAYQDLKNSNIINNKPYYDYDQTNCLSFGTYYTNNLEGNNIFGPGTSLTANFSGTSIPIKAYLGTSKKESLRKVVADALNSNYSGLFDLDSVAKVPSPFSHGMVWKILVNGKDAQDEYELMDPVGVGTHKIQVYFNRPMDTLVAPQISYGVVEPYNQKIIFEEGSWSADGKIYNVDHEVKIGAADGINRIRVQEARDLDYFEIPVEDFRFNMLVQSAGSASSGFFATPELGKIVLEWEEPSADLLEDVLGYNMYRHEAVTDSTFTEPVKINGTLISNVSFSDFEVEEGKKYFYQYKILRTNFEESDFSKTVSASPLTSKLGDSNGDFAVNVLDLVQDVDYILGNNPQPFIFKAADVNADQTINVLDIVGTVDIINAPSTASMIVSAANPSIAYYSNEAIGEVEFYWEEDDLYMKSEHPVGAFQLAFEEGFSYEINKGLSSFEWSNYKQEDSRIVMMYSFNGTAIKAGKTKILARNSADSALNIEKAVVGTPKGEKLAAIFSDKDLSGIEAPKQADKLQVVKFWPNPTDGIVNLQYYLPETMDAVVVSVFNLQGTRVMSSDSLKNTVGPGEKEFNLSNLTPGIYLFVVDAVRGGEIKHREAKKIIIR